jgi:RNA polymerase sigma factor (sigma-70 family)
MSSASPDDATLLALWCRGEATAAQALYERHGAALLRFAAAMLPSRQAAEDVVHDTFVELLRRPDRFDAGRGPLAAYLYGIARHRLSRVARLSLREAELRSEQTAEEGAHEAESPASGSPASEPAFAGADELLDRAQTIERVRAAVHDLPLVHREVVALCDLEELPYATVATILDCPIGTVRSRLHRARALLSVRLAAFGDAAGNHETPSTTGSMMLSCRGTLR